MQNVLDTESGTRHVDLVYGNNLHSADAWYETFIFMPYDMFIKKLKKGQIRTFAGKLEEKWNEIGTKISPKGRA